MDFLYGLVLIWVSRTLLCLSCMTRADLWARFRHSQSWPACPSACWKCEERRSKLRARNLWRHQNRMLPPRLAGYLKDKTKFYQKYSRLIIDHRSQWQLKSSGKGYWYEWCFRRGFGAQPEASRPRSHRSQFESIRNRRRLRSSCGRTSTKRQIGC